MGGWCHLGHKSRKDVFGRIQTRLAMVRGYRESYKR